nr:MAG TPA: hypothetical protein [Caudoviricetes sp.]
MSAETAAAACMIALTVVACLAFAALIVALGTKAVADARKSGRRDAADSSSSAERCRACSSGVCALRSADEDLAERGDAR